MDQTRSGPVGATVVVVAIAGWVVDVVVAGWVVDVGVASVVDVVVVASVVDVVVSGSRDVDVLVAGCSAVEVVVLGGWVVDVDVEVDEGWVVDVVGTDTPVALVTPSLVTIVRAAAELRVPYAHSRMCTVPHALSAVIRLARCEQKVRWISPFLTSLSGIPFVVGPTFV